LVKNHLREAVFPISRRDSSNIYSPNVNEETFLSIIRRMKHRFPRICGILLPMVLLFSPLSLEAEVPGDYRTELEIDWSGGEIALTFIFSIEDEVKISPRLRESFITESSLRLGTEFVYAMYPLRIDSRQSVEDFLKEKPRAAVGLSSLVSESYESRSAAYAKDYSEFRVKYRYSLFPDIIALFFSHRDAALPVPLLRYLPSGPYSGIVIYVERELPLYGTTRQTTLRPAFFPRIFNEEMELVLSKEMIRPKELRRWGAVGYYSFDQIDRLPERVGEVPFYCKARALFGIGSTDLIISNGDSDILLSREQTIRLLSEGKIAVVYK
jgi:hypothetical protein